MKASPERGALFEALPPSGEICALMLDSDARVARASAGCARLFRREASSLVGQPAAELFYGGLALPEEASGSCDVEVRRQSRPGYARLFWSRDDRGVTLLLADLERLSAGGLSATAASAHFTSEFVHELRNPLTSLKLIVQTLPRLKNGARAARFFTIALREVRALERIADALAGMLARPSVSLAQPIGPAVEASLGEVGRELAERGVALQVRAPAAGTAVLCDLERLRLALKQLVGGMAHGLEAGEVCVEVSATEGLVDLRLETLPRPASRPSGMDLSVALARKISGEHGGKLRVVEGGFALALPTLEGGREAFASQDFARGTPSPG